MNQALRRLTALCILLPLTSSLVVRAASAAEPKSLLLWPAGAPGALGTEAKDKPQLIVYLPAAEMAQKTGVVICPGGGYGGLAMGHEGHDIAKWFNSMGVAAAILDYRHRGKGYGHPAPLQDAQRGLRTMRHHAKEWNLAPEQIGIIGFSAGGHLASTTVTHFAQGDPDAPDPIERQSCRPDFGILCYPVIAFDEPYTHRGSQKNLLGEDADAELVASLSNEKHVKPTTPPCFLWHTNQDTVVPPENSVQFYLAMRAAEVPGALMIFEKGRHGVGLARDVPGTSQWPTACENWLKSHGFIK